MRPTFAFILFISSLKVYKRNFGLAGKKLFGPTKSRFPSDIAPKYFDSTEETLFF